PSARRGLVISWDGSPPGVRYSFSAVDRRALPESHTDVRPRVFLVDDHRGVLDMVTRMLAADYDIVGIATAGGQAIERAPGLEPDLIVLDVAMPGLDGFETCRALARAGSRAPVVFLSMHDSDEYVSEAFASGGRGYVIKLRTPADLLSALGHVRA